MLVNYFNNISNLKNKTISKKFKTRENTLLFKGVFLHH